MFPTQLNKEAAIFGLILIVILGMNLPVIQFALNNDAIGIVVSLALFVFGGRETKQKVNYLLLLLLLLFEFICYRLHIQSLHFLSIAFLLCIIYYGFTKRFSYIAFICLLLFSTIFNKLFEHLSAEIKQSLCYSAFVTLRNVIEIDKIEGITFFIKQTKITVDTACMGLSMFKSGLLTASVLLTLEERKHKLYYSIFQIILFCCVVIILNIISNYFRIISLILFQCTEENLLHHTIGLVCFGLYQVAPMLFLIRYFKPKIQEVTIEKTKPNYLIIFISIIVVFITSLEMKSKKNNNLLTHLSPEYPLSKGKWVNEDVFKIELPNRLIYIKTPLHKPLICWTGDGYKITETKEIIRNGDKIWFNKMVKNNQVYHSYWWYESGDKKYTSYIEVMFIRLVYNEEIRLINETIAVN